MSEHTSPRKDKQEVMKSYSGRILHEKPMIKYFIERYNRGRCYDEECECFPPWRGPTCELEETYRGSMPIEERQNACMHYIMPETERDVADIEISLPSIWYRFNHKFDYPIIIFHEGMSEASRRRIVG